MCRRDDSDHPDDNDDAIFRSDDLKGVKSQKIIRFRRQVPPFTCSQRALFDGKLGRENRSTYSHCVRLPIYLHHLLPEEQAKLYLGLYPVETEVMYIKKERFKNGQVFKSYYYRKCSEMGWDPPVRFSVPRSGEKFYARCQSSIDEGGATDLGFPDRLPDIRGTPVPTILPEGPTILPESPLKKSDEWWRV